jgi:hypothetical protein
VDSREENGVTYNFAVKENPAMDLLDIMYSAPAFVTPNIAAHKPGDIVAVTLTGKVCVAFDNNDYCFTGSLPSRYPKNALYLGDREITSLTVTKAAPPVWQPGDVIMLKHTPSGGEYTYVRGQRTWPGELVGGKTDADVHALYAKGLVRHVLRDGKPVTA